MKNPDKITLLLAHPEIAGLLGIEVDDAIPLFFHSFKFKRNGQRYQIHLREGKRGDKNVLYKEIEISKEVSMIHNQTIIRSDIETWDDIKKLLGMFNELVK